MDILERIWEYLGLFFGGLLRGFERSITAVFGSSNARYIRRLQAQAALASMPRAISRSITRRERQPGAMN